MMQEFNKTQEFKNWLLERHIILITTQEECDGVNALLRLGFKVLYYGNQGWTIFNFHNSYITIKDNVLIKQIDSISIGLQHIVINKTYIPIYLCNNLKLNMSNG